MPLRTDELEEVRAIVRQEVAIAIAALEKKIKPITKLPEEKKSDKGGTK